MDKLKKRIMKTYIHLKQLLTPFLLAVVSVTIIVIAGNRVKPYKADSVIAGKQADPLPSWNEGSLKTAIIDYVKKVTNAADAGFIPVEDRIATFDNDGTLWAEQLTIQLEYAKLAFKKIVQ